MTQEDARSRRPLVYEGGNGAVSPSSEDHDDEREPPRLSRRLLTASLAAAIALTGSALGTLAVTDVNPTAFAIFETPASSSDEEAGAALAARGVPVIGVPRVLQAGDVTVAAAFAPAGTAKQLADSLGYVLIDRNRPPDPAEFSREQGQLVVPDEVEVCLWAIAFEGSPRGRCSAVDRFVNVGLAVALDEQTLETVALWSPDGAVEVQRIPRGPVSLDELRALDSAAVGRLEAEVNAVPDDLEADTIIEPFAVGSTVIPPRIIAGTDEWTMAAGVYQPTEGGGLAICIAVATRDGDSSSSAILPAAYFAEYGATAEVDLGTRSVAWEWRADGVVIFDGKEL